MKEILVVTKRLHENMKNELELFKAGMLYDGKNINRKTKHLEKIYDVLGNLKIEVKNNYVCYYRRETFEKLESDSLIGMKTCIDVFIEELSAACKKEMRNKEMIPLLDSLSLQMADIKEQWQ